MDMGIFCAGTTGLELGSTWRHAFPAEFQVTFNIVKCSSPGTFFGKMVLLFTLFARVTPWWTLLLLQWMLVPEKLTGDLRLHI